VKRTFISIVASAVTLTACGGSDSATDTAATTEAVTATEPDVTEPLAAEPPDTEPTTTAPPTTEPSTATTTIAPAPTVFIGTSTGEEATQFLDQWVVAWNAGDEEALFGVFVPDGVLVGTDKRPLVGEEVAVAWAHFVPQYSMERTGDAVTNDDGSFSFTVTWRQSELLADKRILDIALDGDTVRMVERFAV
jgi:hypothetical protein